MSPLHQNGDCVFFKFISESDFLILGTIAGLGLVLEIERGDSGRDEGLSVLEFFFFGAN